MGNWVILGGTLVPWTSKGPLFEDLGCPWDHPDEHKCSQDRSLGPFGSTLGAFGVLLWHPGALWKTMLPLERELNIEGLGGALGPLWG